MNYNSFKVNFWLQPIPVILPILKMIQKQVQMDELQDSEVMETIINWSFVLIALQTKHYLKQKELIRAVIL
jgi:hypothetical protein